MKPQYNWRIAALVLFVFAIFVPASLAQQATFATPILVVNTSFLNVRTGPGSEYSVLFTAVGGAELPVLAVAKDLVWYQVNTDGGVGWVNITFTLARGDFSRVPFAEAPIVIVDATSLGQGGGSIPSTTVTSIGNSRVTGFALNGGDLRDEPNSNALILYSGLPVDPNMIYPLLNAVIVAGETWYQIDVPAIGYGWTNKIALRLLACNQFNIGVTVGDAPIRFDGFAKRDSYILERGSEFYLKGFKGNEYFIVEDVNQTEGLIAITDIQPRPDTVISRCDLIPANFGVTNTANGSAAASAGQGGGAAVPVPSLQANIAIVNTGNLNIRSGPSFNFASIAVVPGGTQLTVLGIASDRVWMYVEGTFGRGWINQDFILFRGNPNTVPTLDF